MNQLFGGAAAGGMWYTYMYMPTYIQHTYRQHTYIHTYIHTCIESVLYDICRCTGYICAYIYMRINTQTHARHSHRDMTDTRMTHIHNDVHRCTYAHSYVHRYVYSCAHTHTHTYTLHKPLSTHTPVYTHAGVPPMMGNSAQGPIQPQPHPQPQPQKPQPPQ